MHSDIHIMLSRYVWMSQLLCLRTRSQLSTTHRSLSIIYAVQVTHWVANTLPLLQNAQNAHTNIVYQKGRPRLWWSKDRLTSVTSPIKVLGNWTSLVKAPRPLPASCTMQIWKQKRGLATVCKRPSLHQCGASLGGREGARLPKIRSWLSDLYALMGGSHENRYNGKLRLARQGYICIIILHKTMYHLYACMHKSIHLLHYVTHKLYNSIVILLYLLWCVQNYLLSVSMRNEVNCGLYLYRLLY